ncbi:MAG: iron ABC transporter substrate-binding protein [Desulfarculus sp.]|nr:iron ABC transporter substrate-binding protein [Desulfarculus sp.]
MRSHPVSLRAVLLLALAMPMTALAQPLTVTDLVGRQVTIPAEPRRVVCLAPGSLRLIAYLQATDRVVGVEDIEKKNPHGRPYRLAHPELAELPTVGPGGPGSINREPDLEAILRVNPEVVFVTNMEARLADRVQARLGAPVVVLSYGRFASFDPVVYDSLRLAGRILGRAERAEAVVNFIEAARRDLQARTANLAEDQRAPAYIGGIGFQGEHGLESTDADYIPFTWVGVTNLAKTWGKAGHQFVEREQILALDPPIIFVDGAGLGRLEGDAARRPQFYRSLSAFRAGRVYLLHPFNWYVTNLGTTLADAYAIGKRLYPAAYADLDPEAKADEIYTFLLGRPVQAQMAAHYGPLGQALDLVAPAKGE